MSNRMVREGLIDSERVLSLPADVRWFFLSIVLTADDLGLFEATPFKLGRRATISTDSATRYLQLLVDVDLARLYVVAGKQYGFVPRFRQRIQIQRLRFPPPPAALLADDEDALSKINDLAFAPTDGQPLPRGFTSATQPSEAKAKAEGIEETSPPSGSKSLVDATAVASTRYRAPSCPTVEIVALYHRHLPLLAAVEVLNAGRKRTLAARWKEVCVDGKFDRAQGLEWFAWYFGRVASSGFLTGRVPGKSGRAWKADFDFLCRPSKFVNVVEGRYHQDGATA